jgi:hypothetical protein
VLPSAASARAKMGTKRLYAQGRGFYQTLYNPLGKLFSFTDNTHVCNVSRSRKRHKEHFAVYMCQSVAFSCKRSDGNSFLDYRFSFFHDVLPNNKNAKKKTYFSRMIKTALL